MTIPPASERQYCSCDSCVFFVYVEERCNITGDIIDSADNEEDPCPDHFTSEEMRVLIDQHNRQEQTPRYYGANEIADLIAEDDRKQEQQP